MSDRHTLYLSGSQPLRVLRDGPALRIRSRDQADRLYPLPWISRIIAGRSVEWDTAALLGCAEQGVAIHFISGEGGILARCLPGNPHLGIPALGAALMQLVANPSGCEQYEDWWRAEERRAWLETAALLDRSRESPQALRQMLAARGLALCDKRELKRVDTRLLSLLSAHLADWLKEAGIDPDVPEFTGCGVDLSRDFARLLVLHLQADKLRILARRRARARRLGKRCPIPSLAETAALEEQREATLHMCFRAMLRRLHLLTLHHLNRCA